jgi:hypothetical protein
MKTSIKSDPGVALSTLDAPKTADAKAPRSPALSMAVKFRLLNRKLSKAQAMKQAAIVPAWTREMTCEESVPI